MDYSITDLMKAASMMSKKYFGRQDEYTISFTKEDDGCWYVDYPDWPFDHHNLMMVEGADDLCEILSYDGTHTKIKGLCPVTLFVLGQYPDYMWIKPMNLSEEKKQSLGLH